MHVWLYKTDRTRNRVTRQKVEVTPIEDKIKEGRLRWFGKRRDHMNLLARKNVEINLGKHKKGRGRPRKSYGMVR